ncbi:AEC family transporter [Psychromarinibacter halotolerans]|uniref:AEC family transporter n=1 Tax=Psychromarinibacter halotolerans TaxID=1775175 RepID=A0ABV7GT43_9RHOB|nr:AEC family transporter [Psychromarinibacter halotolerans]MDF0597236.1 AEC family transporter [Psychromarinibacter halotolerans]
MSLALTILPIALAIALGWAARASGLIKADLWPGIEALSFKLLIPAILIHSIATTDLSPSRIGGFAAALLLTILIGGLVVLVGGRLLRVPGPTRSTYFQGTIRYNGFIGLAAADLLIGPAGLSLIAVSMAVLIPVINVVTIIVMAVLCGGSTGPRRLLRSVATNPLVIGSCGGVAVNLLFGGLPVWLDEATQIVGRAALGVGLLAVGAGVSLKRMLHVSPRVVAACAMRPFMITAIFLGLAMLLGLSETEMLGGILVFAVPAATNGFIVARMMGGDAATYADMLAWQTLLCLIAIPFYAALVT